MLSGIFRHAIHFFVSRKNGTYQCLAKWLFFSFQIRTKRKSNNNMFAKIKFTQKNGCLCVWYLSTSRNIPSGTKPKWLHDAAIEAIFCSFILESWLNYTHKCESLVTSIFCCCVCSQCVHVLLSILIVWMPATLRIVCVLCGVLFDCYSMEFHVWITWYCCTYM